MLRPTLPILRISLNILLMLLCLSSYLLAIDLFLAHSPYAEKITQPISRIASEKFAAQLSIKDAKLSILPLPGMHLQGIHLHKEKQLSATIKDIYILPQVYDLLQGKLNIQKIVMNRAEVNFKSSNQLKHIFPEDLGNYLNSGITGTKITISDSRVIISAPRFEQLQLNQIRACIELGPDIDLQASASSNLARSIALRMQGKAAENNYKGKMQLQDLSLTKLSSRLLPASPWAIAASSIDLDLDFQTSLFSSLQVQFAGNFPKMRLQYQKTGQNLAGTVQGKISTSGRRTKINVSKINLMQPALRARADLSLNHENGNKHLCVQLQGLNLKHLNPVLIKAQKESTLLKKIRRIIKDGYVPQLSFLAHGQNREELLANLNIQGNLQRGRIHLPYINRTLSKSSADFQIKNEILQVNNISGYIDKILASSAELRLGFNPELKPFALTASFQGPFEEIPAQIFKEFSQNKLLEELKKLKNIQGKTQGQIKIEKQNQEFKTRLLLQDLYFSGLHPELPLQLHAHGQELIFSNSGMSAQGFDVHLGNSDIHGLNIAYSWQGDRSLQISSPKSYLHLISLYPYLAKHEELHEYLQHVPVCNAEMLLSGFSLDTDLEKPHQLEINSDISLISHAQKDNQSMALIDFQAAYSGRKLQIQDLLIQDKHSRAFLDFELYQDVLGYNYRGTLSAETLHRFFPQVADFSQGRVQGKLQGEIQLKDPQWEQARGDLSLMDLRINLPGTAPLRLKKIRLLATENLIIFPETELQWRNCQIGLQGKISKLSERHFFELELQANKLDYALWQALDKKMQFLKKDISNANLQGRLDLNIGSFSYKKYTWEPMAASLIFGQAGTCFKARQPESSKQKQPEGFKSAKSKSKLVIGPKKDKNKQHILLEIEKAKICSIPTPGCIHFQEDKADLIINSSLQDLSLAKVIRCFTPKKEFISGSFDLDLSLQAKQASLQNITRSLQGQFDFQARQGRIHHFHILSKIMALLNSTEILFNNLPQMTKEGMGYNQISIQGRIEQGILEITSGNIDGDSMEIGMRGEVDLVRKKMDLTLLMCPLKTVDRLFKAPVLEKITGGNLVCIPVRASGDLDSPDVTPLSPKAVGSGLYNFMKNTLKLPFTLFQPLFPDEKDKD